MYLAEVCIYSAPPLSEVGGWSGRQGRNSQSCADACTQHVLDIITYRNTVLLGLSPASRRSGERGDFPAEHYVWRPVPAAMFDRTNVPATSPRSALQKRKTHVSDAEPGPQQRS